MSLACSGSVKLQFLMSLINTGDDGIAVSDPASKSFENAFTNGTGANKAQLTYHAQRTITTGSSIALDLRALTASTDGSVFGTYVFSKLKAIGIALVTATTGYVLNVTPGDSNPFSALFGGTTETQKIGAGGFWAITSPVDGWTVDSSHRTIKIANPAGGTATLVVFAVGEGTVS